MCVFNLFIYLLLEDIQACHRETEREGEEKTFFMKNDHAVIPSPISPSFGILSTLAHWHTRTLAWCVSQATSFGMQTTWLVM